MGAKGIIKESDESTVFDSHFTQNHTEMLEKYNDISKVHPVSWAHSLDIQT